MRSKLLCAILAFSLIMTFGGNSWSDEEGSKSLIVDDGIYRHPIMKPDMATLREWMKEYENAPRAFIDKRLMKTMPLTGSLDLLSHLDYTPSERNQGTCGDCWVWSGTGILEIAHSVQDSIKDRLSIQYMNSCYSTDYACCGGTLTKFSDFYNSAGYVYPWSNTNASFQDGSKRCSDGSSSVSCGSVSTSPSYGILSLSDVTIATLNENQSTAIANIKNVLNQNKAVQLGFYLANDADWNVFYDFWNNDSESDLFSFDYSSGHTWVDGEGGGHAVLVVGYDDTDPNPYWIVLNSWGTETGRPNGLFRLDMNTDYNCYFYDPGDGKNYGSLLFQTLDTGGSSNTTTTSVPEVNLKPHTPSGWDYPIVPASTMWTNYVDKLCGGKPTYIDIAAINEGPNDIPETFYIDIYIDGIQEGSWYGDGLEAGYYAY
ncbi:MAG: C1 family peptidase, partial [Deltaproteobacteria bacterium]|nr:C1 family peptidase [Deltaproteobacteria bacterium]